MRKKTGFDNILTLEFNAEDLNRRVSISVDRSNIFSVLKEVFAGTNVRYSVLDKKIILSVEVQSPQQEKKMIVSGIISDVQGEPVIGASIQEKGVVGKGTVSDLDGKFKLTVASDAILVISYIGFQSLEVKVGNRTNLSVVLKEDHQLLDEVVVIGYGTMEKRAVTSSITSISSKDLVTGMGGSTIATALKGKISGGFIKREGRPGEQAILTSRLIDRPIRPMFPDGYHNDVQIVATAVSVDPDNAPDMPAMIGASCALSISDIPFEGPIAGVRVGLVDGEFVINPTVEQAKVSLLNLAVAGTKDAILMVEAGAKEVSEETMLDAIWFAHGVIKELVAFQEKIMAEVGKPKMEVPVYEPPAEIAAEIEAYGADKLKEALMDANKLEREENVAKVKAEIAEVFIEKYPDNAKDVAYITQKLVKKIVRRTISVDKIRPDGRQLDEVRPVTCEVGLLARPHGSALFTRGQTQILNVLALAPLREAQILDGLGVEDTKRYIHHYNFPPCVPL